MKHIWPLRMLLLISTIAASIDKSITPVPFDPLDPVYQIQSKYPPNMTSTWTYGLEYDGWWIAHEALRGEVLEFQMALESLSRSASSLPATNENTDHRVLVRKMQKWWRAHLKHMHSHHRNEDRIVKSFATQRFRWPEFIEADHHDISQLLDKIDRLVQRIVKVGTSVPSTTTKSGSISPPSDSIISCMAELRSIWDDYHQVVFRHLAQEEEVCIALLRAYFHPNQVQGMQHRLAMMGPRVEMGAIVHYVGEDCLKASMKAQRTPRVMELIGWNFILKPRHGYYMNTVVKQLEILKHARLE